MAFCTSWPAGATTPEPSGLQGQQVGQPFPSGVAGGAIQSVGGLRWQLLWGGRQRDIPAEHQRHVHFVVYTGRQRVQCEGFNKQATNGNFYGTCYPAANGPQHVCRVTTSGAVTPIFQYPTGSNGLSPANGILTQGPDGFLYGVAVGGPGGTGFQVIFQLSTSGSFTELYQSNGCTPKTGCSRVMQASDGNLWIANPPGESVYSITTSGGLLQTVSFSSQPNAYAHPQLLIQASSGILYGTTGEPNPAYYDVGSVFSLDAGLPPPQ